MAKAIEMTSVEHIVTDSELIKSKDNVREFDFKLDEKAAKGKLIKGAKRIPFEIVKNTSSSNFIFNLGSWHHVVQPSIRYWIDIKGIKSCKIGDSIVKIADVKTGKDIGGNHIDTQIVFFFNRDKVVLHCYNTTQLILTNGHGYTKLIEEFLKPYFESKISINMDDILKFNENALDVLGNKTTGRLNFNLQSLHLIQTDASHGSHSCCVEFLQNDEVCLQEDVLWSIYRRSFPSQQPL